MDYKVYSTWNFRTMPQLKDFSEERLIEMEVVSNVLPFKTNNYVVEQLIDWDSVPNDPIFNLTFPRKEMLLPHHYEEMEKLIKEKADPKLIKETADRIRMQLNPHPAGQVEHNVPVLNGEPLPGIQHKYRETMLFFPSQGQTCHAYCSFCFRWPQFVGLNKIKFAMKEADKLAEYARQHPFISDVLFTGGDPAIMKTDILEAYIRPLLESKTITTIRIGTKALSYWPYRFTEDDDAEKLMDLFADVAKAGKHLTIMAHVNNVVELKTTAVQKAIKTIRSTGAQIRTQSPLLRNINDSPEAWRDMWKKQVSLGMVPYYMFVVRDTGAQHYFGITLFRAWQIFREAYSQVSGISRTVRGPSMSAGPGKVHVLGVQEINGEKAFVLEFLQARNPEWVRVPFFAKFNPKAIWLNDLKPFYGEKFFYEDDYKRITAEKELQHKKSHQVEV